MAFSVVEYLSNKPQRIA